MLRSVVDPAVRELGGIPGDRGSAPQRWQVQVLSVEGHLLNEPVMRGTGQNRGGGSISIAMMAAPEAMLGWPTQSSWKQLPCYAAPDIRKPPQLHRILEREARNWYGNVHRTPATQASLRLGSGEPRGTVRLAKMDGFWFSVKLLTLDPGEGVEVVVVGIGQGCAAARPSQRSSRRQVEALELPRGRARAGPRDDSAP